VTSELQENVMKVRMLPIAQLFSRYPRLVHDLVRNTKKKVELEIFGEETELDKMVIEQLADPLIHIIRNAVDHGIEEVAARRQKGKPETGVLRLEAYHEANFVIIEISDDGQGIDVPLVKKRALEKGFASATELEQMKNQELMSLIMRPGFSTAAEITHTSGRGVGMDVVKDSIEKLNGTIELESNIGTGARFKIKIPLTLAIITALLVRLADEIFAIPLSTVEETIRIEKDEISTIEGVEVFYLRDSTIPLIRLDRVFNMAADSEGREELFVVVVNTGAKHVGFVVDELKAQQEVVIKPLEDYLQEKSGFSGATILGDGSISLILDVYELVELSLDQHSSKSSAAVI
jgi:two-component system chemotaxis sensor kinase CheA